MYLKKLQYNLHEATKYISMFIVLKTNATHAQLDSQTKCYLYIKIAQGDIAQRDKQWLSFTACYSLCFYQKTSRSMEFTTPFIIQ